VLEDLLAEPATFIAETLTGMLGDGVKGVSASGGRIVQAILKGKSYQQFDVELKRWRTAGRIAPDFGEKKYGFQTWVELMTIIDEESFEGNVLRSKQSRRLRRREHRSLPPLADSQEPLVR
jgi:hypothetical protein